MRSLKLWFATLFVSVLAFPVIVGGTVFAQPVPVVQCTLFDGEFSDSTSLGCDLEIKKEVSVSGGAFVDANTSPEAAQATVGNSVVWKITITNPAVPDDGYIPTGGVRVTDVLPSGVSYISSTASEGSYDNSTNIWEFNMGLATTFPITLTINTTAASVGLFENIASLSEYNSELWVEYSDFNPENNSDNAWVNISAAPVVLAATTGTPVVLAATGSGTTGSLVAAGLIAATLGTLGYSRFARKNS